MAYLGNTPVAEYYDSKTEQYSGDGSTIVFTLSREVATANDVEVIVNNVQQDPYTAFSASGTTLTFTEAPSLGSGNILVTYRNYLTTRLIPNAQSVTSSMIEDGTITANNIANATITGAKLVANTITAREIADNSVLQNNIVTGAVTASKLASTSVTPGTYGGTEKISVVTVDQQGRLTYAANVTIQQPLPNILMLSGM